MTLDEAIQHCDEVAAECELYEIEIEYACGKEHRQLAAWLRELKELKKYSVPEEDYIDREAVLDYIRYKVCQGEGNIEHQCQRGSCAYCGICEIMCDISSMPAAGIQPVDRWISVDEALPVYDGMVLVCDKSKNIRLGIYTDMGWCSQFGNPMMCKITHWQPLPKPPNE